MRPLPVARITDEIKPYGPDLAQNPLDFAVHADFYYIDAGEPLNHPLEALQYMEPNWYWCENAIAIMYFGYSKKRQGEPITCDCNIHGKQPRTSRCFGTAIHGD